MLRHQVHVTGVLRNRIDAEGAEAEERAKSLDIIR
jgi:hypothetical protein